MDGKGHQGFSKVILIGGDTKIQTGRPSLAALTSVLFCVLVVLLAGCATPKKKAPDVLKVTITTCPYQITQLDTATLTFANGSVKELTVNHDGTIETDSGRVPVAGKSVAEFKALLTNNFPEVSTITVHEFRTDRISVLGEVFHQIHTEAGNGPMRLMDAIAAANGFTALADKQHVRVVRENAGTVETYEIDFRQLLRGENMQQNILIKPGDVITVPRDFL